MYHMMEVYNEIGLPEIIAQDIASGVGSFFVVALGGTAIGKIKNILIIYVTYLSNNPSFVRHHLGFPNRSGDTLHGSCTRHRTDLYIRYGLSGISECGNLPHERHSGVSMKEEKSLYIIYIHISFNYKHTYPYHLSISFSTQHHILWHYDEELCGIEYFTKIAYDR